MLNWTQGAIHSSSQKSPCLFTKPDGPLCLRHVLVNVCMTMIQIKMSSRNLDPGAVPLLPLCRGETLFDAATSLLLNWLCESTLGFLAQNPFQDTSFGQQEKKSTRWDAIVVCESNTICLRISFIFYAPDVNIVELHNAYNSQVPKKSSLLVRKLSHTWLLESDGTESGFLALVLNLDNTPP